MRGLEANLRGLETWASTCLCVSTKALSSIFFRTSSAYKCLYRSVSSRNCCSLRSNSAVSSPMWSPSALKSETILSLSLGGGYLQASCNSLSFCRNSMGRKTSKFSCDRVVSLSTISVSLVSVTSILSTFALAVSEGCGLTLMLLKRLCSSYRGNWSEVGKGGTSSLGKVTVRRCWLYSPLWILANTLRCCSMTW